MFTFADLRLFHSFAFGVTVLGVLWVVVRRSAAVLPVWPARSIPPGTIWGGALFGARWALCGACPGIALVQIGEGQLGALWTLGGMLLGNGLYSIVHERYFRWPRQSCVED
jgi:uncharacterized membrane protein YedE/YeeE